MQGRQLTHFRVLSQLGAGGMGEVWAAEDTKLGRQVALKLLPPAFTAQPARLARFEREARLLAALNHPAIAAIYSFESAVPEPPVPEPPVPERAVPELPQPEASDDQEPVHFLVMELARGESLQRRLRRGALPLPEVLAIARQICGALEAAHAQGIVHRDLKPANVMVDDDAKVKVLDFGLAKALSEPDAAFDADPDLSHSPTLAVAATSAGAVLGTASYMSPEQATGKSVDKRADIWAFGTVLWEMLTGRPLFDADSVPAILAEVLRAPIDFAELPPSTPAPLRELVRRCVERNRDRRLHDIADARLVLEDLESGEWEDAPAAPATTPTTAGRRPALLALAAAAAAGLVVGAAATRLLLASGEAAPPETPETPEPMVRFEIAIPDAAQAKPALSPEARRVAYASGGLLWIRDLDRLEPTAVAGSEGASAPFWSPDGESLGYFAERAVWHIPVAGGRPTLLTQVPPGTSNTGLWLPDDRILFTTGASGVLEVSARGGPARPLVDLLPGEVDFHGLASFGPGALLATVHQLEAEQYGNATVLAGDRRIPLFDLPGESVWGPVVAPESGWLVFERMGHNAARGLWAVPIELEPPRASGSPVLLAPAGATPSLTGDTLVYAPTPDVHTNQLVWVNRTGAVVENVGVPRPGLYPAPALSPDGRTAAVTVAQRLGSNLWTVDLASGAFQQTSFDAGSTLSAPAWTPDGEQLYYYVSTATDDQRILRKRADGSTLVDEVTGGSLEAAISPDGRTLAFSRALPGFRMDLWLRDLETGAETELSATPDWDRHPDFSPDGRLVAFVASGAVVVAEVPPGTGRWQIAPSGNAPRFGAGGRRLYYLAGETMMEVAIEPGPPLRAAQPVPLFERSHAPAEWLAPTFDVDAEGERFLMVVPAGRPPGLVVVRHWQRALGR